MCIRTFERRNGSFAEAVGSLVAGFGSLARANGTFEGENGSLAQLPELLALRTFFKAFE